MQKFKKKDLWNFVHNEQKDATWKTGLREIFNYRDLGIKDGTNGEYIAHIIKANGKELKDEVNFIIKTHEKNINRVKKNKRSEILSDNSFTGVYKVNL